MVSVRVNGGTGAGRKWRPERAGTTRCVGCGGFISEENAEQGHTRCALCRDRKAA